MSFILIGNSFICGWFIVSCVGQLKKTQNALHHKGKDSVKFVVDSTSIYLPSNLI